MCKGYTPSDGDVGDDDGAVVAVARAVQPHQHTGDVSVFCTDVVLGSIKKYLSTTTNRCRNLIWNPLKFYTTFHLFQT